MKIRTDYVTNSSTGNFIVPVQPLDWSNKCRRDKRLITKAQEQQLLAMGFQYVVRPYATELREDSLLPTSPRRGEYHMGLLLGCNQYDLAAQLVKMDIAFWCDSHYGHEHIIYDNRLKKVYILPNKGTQAEMHCGYACKPEGEKIEQILSNPLPEDSVMDREQFIKENLYEDAE